MSRPMLKSHAILRYALETNDPWVSRLVRQAEARESIVDLSREHGDALRVHSMQ